eukprot:g16029.t1
MLAAASSAPRVRPRRPIAKNSGPSLLKIFGKPNAHAADEATSEEAHHDHQRDASNGALVEVERPLAETLPALTLQREQAEEATGGDFPFDLRRTQLIARLFELVSEQAEDAQVVLQQDVAQLFLQAGIDANVFFYSSDEINSGCVEGPTLSLQEVVAAVSSHALSYTPLGVAAAFPAVLDDRLCVTPELFESLLQEMTNLELAQSVDAFLDHALLAETSWAVDTPVAGAAGVKLKGANGLAVYESDLFIADSMSHAIFRVRNWNNTAGGGGGAGAAAAMAGAAGAFSSASSGSPPGRGSSFAAGGTSCSPSHQHPHQTAGNGHLLSSLELFAGKLQMPGFRDGPRALAQFNGPCGLCICRRTEQLFTKIKHR